MYRIHVAPTPMCLYRLGDQAAEHVLQDCPESWELRNKFWPTDVTLDGNCMEQERHSKQWLGSSWEKKIGAAVNKMWSQDVITGCDHRGIPSGILGMWCLLHLFRPIGTQWVVCLIWCRRHLLLRIFNGAHFWWVKTDSYLKVDLNTWPLQIFWL